MTKDKAAAILGIDVTSNYEVARKSYIAQARLVHPDRFILVVSQISKLPPALCLD